MTILAQRILELRSQGKSYREIQKELGCSKASIAFHCGKDQKKKAAERAKKSPHVALRKKLSGFCNDYGRNSGNRASGYRSSRGYMKVVKQLEENPVCYLTGRKIDLSDMSSFSFDHKIPLSRGGASEIENLGLTCREANKAKCDMTPEEFVEFCKEVLIHHGYKIS